MFDLTILRCLPIEFSESYQLIRLSVWTLRNLCVYTDDPKVGYLSKKGVEALRSALGNHIFHDEMTHIFREQTDRRDQLKKGWKAMLDEILQKISENKYSNPEVEQKLLLLSDKLSRTKGKKVYSGANARKVQDVLKKYTRIRSQEEIREFFRNVKSESYQRRKSGFISTLDGKRKTLSCASRERLKSRIRNRRRLKEKEK